MRPGGPARPEKLRPQRIAELLRGLPILEQDEVIEIIRRLVAERRHHGPCSRRCSRQTLEIGSNRRSRLTAKAGEAGSS